MRRKSYLSLFNNQSIYKKSFSDLSTVFTYLSGTNIQIFGVSISLFDMFGIAVLSLIVTIIIAKFVVNWL